MYQLLFIHPDSKLTSIYQKFLRPTFQVDSAHDGLQGLRLIKTTRPQIIISEYDLSQISGLTLLSFIRQHSTLASIPFLFLSQKNLVEDSLNLGANEWLVQSQSSPREVLTKCLQHLNLSKISKQNYYV